MRSCDCPSDASLHMTLPTHMPLSYAPSFAATDALPVTVPDVFPYIPYTGAYAFPVDVPDVLPMAVPDAIFVAVSDGSVAVPCSCP